MVSKVLQRLQGKRVMYIPPDKRKGLSQKAKKKVKTMIQKQMGSDLNIFYNTKDNQALSTAGTAGGTVYELNAMAQGVTEGTRVSQTIKNMFLDISFRVSGDDVSADGQNSPQPKTRIIIFKQKVSVTGALLTTPTLMFSNLANEASMLHEPLPQWNSRGTFKVYYDRVITNRTPGVNESTTVPATGVMTPDSWIIAETNCIRVKRKLKGIKSTFTSTTAASINQNAIYIAFLPQTTAGRVSMVSRLIYQD